MGLWGSGGHGGTSMATRPGSYYVASFQQNGGTCKANKFRARREFRTRFNFSVISTASSVLLFSSHNGVKMPKTETKTWLV